MPIPDKLPFWAIVYMWIGMILFTASRFTPKKYRTPGKLNAFMQLITAVYLWPFIVAFLIYVYFKVKQEGGK